MIRTFLVAISFVVYIFATCTSNVTMGNHKFINLATPINSNDMATKKYADTLSKYGVVVDHEGWIHPTIKIGTQTWMADNMYVITYNGSGDSLLGDEINSTWDCEENSIYSFSYPHDSNYGPAGFYFTQGNETNKSSLQRKMFGNFYQWGAMVDDIDSNITIPVQGICPDGWHIPSLDEFNATLANFLGGASIAGAKMKTGGSSGFNIVFAGDRNAPFGDNHSGFYGRGKWAIFWTSTDVHTSRYIYAWTVSVDNEPTNESLYFSPDYRQTGHSVRCLKD